MPLLHQHHSSLTLVLLALLSTCVGIDIVCEDQQDFQDCIQRLNSDVPNTTQGECTDENSQGMYTYMSVVSGSI